MGVPNISIRQHIRWLPEAASEPTSTLVLTSSTSHFVDVRVLKEQPQNGTAHASQSTGPLDQLEWAFAGTSKSTKAAVNAAPSHSVWTHWLDSRTDEVISDEGWMYEQANGDVLEVGRMERPETGELADYEELWSDPAPEMIHGESAFTCIVLKAETDDPTAKGMIIRVGGWCQGILKLADKVTVERWKWTKANGDTGSEGTSNTPLEAYNKWERVNEDMWQSSGQGKWERVVRIGSAQLPCATTWTAAMPDSTEAMAWELVENYSWQ